MTGKRIEKIQRQRLLALLASAPALTWVRAPAGFGKSVLLDQWQDEGIASGVPTFRINLTEEVAPIANLPGELGDLFGVGAVRHHRDLVAALKRYEELRLLIDDADHLLRAPESSAFLLRLKEGVPALRMVFASRGEIGLPLAKYNANGDLLRLEVDVLRFDAQERQRMMELNTGGHFSRNQIDVVHQSFKGWPCGYSLQFQALQHRPVLPSEPNYMRGSWRVLSDYFHEEGFDALPGDLRSFLERISIFAKPDAVACNGLLGIEDSAALLDRSYQLGVPIWPIDPEHKTFEMLPLYREFLSDRLDQKEAADLHDRACTLIEERGDYLAAAMHALAINDHDRAARLLERQVGTDFYLRDETPLLEAASAIDPKVRDRYPLLLLALAMRGIFSFHFEQARKFLDQARKVIEEIGEEREGAPNRQALEILLLHREMLLALGQHDMTKVQAYGDRLLRNMDAIPPMQRVMILNSLTQAQLELYIFRGAERFYVQAKSLIPQLDSWVSSLPLETFYARYLFMTGRTSSAIELLENILGHLVEEMGPKPFLGAIAAVSLAEMKLEIGEVEEARKLLQDYRENAEHFGFLSLILAGRITEARVLIESGEVEKGLESLEHTPISAGELFDRVRRVLAVERIEWLLRTDRERAAKHACHAIGMSLSRPPEPESCAATSEEAYAAAWVRFARSHKRLDEAIQVARKWQRYTEGVGAIKSTVRWNVILASLLTLSGDKAQAMRSLRRAVSLAAPGQYRYAFLCELDVLRESLNTLLQGDIGESERAFLTTILPERAQEDPAGSSREIPLKLVGAFTSRETAILRLLARGMMNREIGDALGMTEGTVKWYLYNIYGKLGIRRRSQIATLVAQWTGGPSGSLLPSKQPAEEWSH